ncbi:hypothetical protein P691DRAFT_671796 [Macrolepiota fuliginosa MF-IS2]|uniref:F-box domain-containing protein n=1 Tax=Macrolepiota fuliginosa MF-IS2 TaxID=1400762 RepID=A0A9P6C142_9AGAR|nr:hypothetical protein P691DRAFT_671796 [Macrolepiota fuliginosa MF-IS2]
MKDLPTLPTELVLEIASILCASSQRDYTTLLLVSRTLRDFCRLTYLPVVPIVLTTPQRTAQFAGYLRTDSDIAPRIRRLWITKDDYGIIPQCTNLTTLTCDGNDLIPIISSDIFYHTQLTNLTIMGLWEFWTRFVGAKKGRTLCGQLQKLWLLDHLFLRGIQMEWLSSLKELSYWSVELYGRQDQFKGELETLNALPRLKKLQVYMRSPSPSIFSQLCRINDRRLEVISWGKRSEVAEWIDQSI